MVFQRFRLISHAGYISTDLKDIRTSNIIPVELNSILCRNAKILSELYLILGRHEKAQQFQDWSKSFQHGIDSVLWNDEDGVWLDYDVRSMKSRNAFYATNIMPLWAECYP